MSELIQIIKRGELKWVNPEEIVYIYALGSYALIVEKNGEETLISRNLKWFMAIVNSVSDLFIQPHRSWAVNIKYIQRLEKVGKEFNLILKNDSVIKFKSLTIRKSLIDSIQRKSVPLLNR